LLLAARYESADKRYDLAARLSRKNSLTARGEPLQSLFACYERKKEVCILHFEVQIEVLEIKQTFVLSY